MNKWLDPRYYQLLACLPFWMALMWLCKRSQQKPVRFSAES